MTHKGWTGMLPWLIAAAVIVLLDQATKQVAEMALIYHQPLAVMPGFNLTLTYNTGAAFSFLSEAGGWQRWFFTVFAAVVSVVLAVWLYRLPRTDRWLACALALVLGGAIGNLYDRVAYGYVIDFIDIYYQHWHWPAFNVADAAICVGAAMLIIDAVWPARAGRASGGG